MKILILLVTFFLILGIPAFAQNMALGQPGLLPDSPFVSVQDFFEQLQLFFAFSPNAKANVHLQLAEKRLAELNLALGENKTDLVPILSDKFEREVNETEKNIGSAKALGQNVTELAQHVAEETFKHQLVLQNLLDKVPEQARLHIENAINKSIQGHEQAVESILENRNVTGIVNITFIIKNQTFTQTFNVTSEHGKSHIEKEHSETEITTTSTTSSTNSISTTTTTAQCNVDLCQRFVCCVGKNCPNGPKSCDDCARSICLTETSITTTAINTSTTTTLT